MPRILGLALLSFATLAQPALSQTAEPNIMAAQTTAPGGARIFAMAQDLYLLGVANKDALTVLTAARLAGSVALQDGAEVKKETRGTAVAGSDDGDSDGPVTVPQMLAMAKELAGEDDLILSLIDDAEVEGARGRVGGAIQRLSGLHGGLTDVWEVPFYGASQSEVAIIGNGDTNLDVLITDANGNTVCVDVSASDKMMCDFVPAENGYFYVTVQNKGESKNSYYLLTN